MSERSSLILLAEPRLEFRYGQHMTRPHDGLALFGPYDADMPSHRRSLTYGLIGTPEGIQGLSAWSGAMRGPCLTPTGPKKLSQNPKTC